MININIKIDGEFIRMDTLMKLSGLVSMGGEAKHLIQDGNVKLNGKTCTERSKKIREGDFIEYEGLRVTVEKGDHHIDIED